MANVKLAWESAEVEDGVLTVTLDGEVPKDWKRSFERTVQLLGGGEWGEIRLKKGAVKVSDISPGSEEKLRHHLESVVAQANAVDEPEEDPGEESDDEPAGPDAEMTAQFRAFAEPREEEA